MSTLYQWRHLVTFSETNLVGNVYFAEYLRWQGCCREAFLFEHAPDTVRRLQARELGLVTLKASMEYFAEAFAGDEITVAMQHLGHTSGQADMGFEFRRNNVLIATGSQAIAAVLPGEQGPIPVAMPADLLSALEAYSD